MVVAFFVCSAVITVERAVIGFYRIPWQRRDLRVERIKNVSTCKVVIQTHFKEKREYINIFSLMG